jgi:hypothetical protein
VSSPSGSVPVKLSLTTSYPEALIQIYEAIGCAEVVRKPVLRYQMSGTGHNGVKLQNENDWTSMIEYSKSQKPKNDTIVGKILVDKEVQDLDS